MAVMAFRLTFCLLVIGLAQSLENSAEYQHQNRSTSGQGKLIFFKAFQARDAVYGVKSTIVFSNVEDNIGGGYNPSTGVFTAPVTGLYGFQYRVQRIAGVKAEVSLLNQNSLGTFSECTQDWVSSGASTIMKVKKGNHVYVKITWSSNNGLITLHAGQLSGYLIREL